MEDSNIYPLAKITPISGKIPEEDIILSNEFCCPLVQIFREEDTSDFSNETLTSVVMHVGSNINDNDSLSSNYELNGNVCYCVLNSFKTAPLSKLKLSVDVILFSIVIDELKRSRAFRTNVLKRFYHFTKLQVEKHQRKLKICLLCNKILWLLHINIYLTPVNKNILDYRWNKKLEVLVNERCELENAMAWLSTLGGAFSALGDYFTDCAEKAGLISVQQFSLALRLGDPITICQCKIYLAMSLIQRYQFHKAKHLIRELYSFAIGPKGSKDFRLKNMCIAVWNKLKYVKSLRRRKRSSLKMIKN